MLDRWFGHNTHYYLHLLGLVGIAVGLPLSKVVLSISTLFLLLNLILKADFKTYWENWKSSRVIQLVALFFLFHIAGLAWSEDLQYGLNDIWKKIPLFIIPIVIAGIPFQKDQDRQFVLLTFVASVLLTSFINFAVYQQWLGSTEVVQFRDMSQFGSHVRYALLVVMAIVIAYNELINNRMKFVAVGVILWLVFYTLYSQVIAGFLAMMVVFFVILFYHFYSRRKAILLIMSGLTITLFIFVLNWLFSTPTLEPSYLSRLDQKTTEGHAYTHDLSLISPETSKPIGEYVCMEELVREWNKVSDMPLDGKDKKNQPLWQTLIRYMASKDLRKDAEGFSKLNRQDVRKVENGCASQYCQGIIARMYGLRYQILNEENPNGHSLLQRLEYWKAGTSILGKSFITGVGTGDVQRSFDLYYTDTNSPLTQENRLRSHNYYITVFISFGIIGLLVFLWMHIEYFKVVRDHLELVGLCFLGVILSSYLTEDTLETQVGVTFFAFFIGLYHRSLKA